MLQHRLKHALAALITLFVLGTGSVMAQNSTSEVNFGASSSPAILTDSVGNIYFVKGYRLCRFNERIQKLDTLYTDINNVTANNGFAGLTMGYADTVIYFTSNDTLNAFNLRTNKKRNVWKGFQYPTNLAFNPADGQIYTTESGLDNGRGCTVGKVNPETGIRTFVAGDSRTNPPTTSNYVNDTANNARFNFPRPNGSYRRGGALAFTRNNDTLLVGDPFNRAIRWVALANNVVGTYAGPLPSMAVSTLFRDSIRYEARFTDINGLAVDHNGFVYVADNGPNQKAITNGNRVRKIDPITGSVRTLAGTGQGLGSGANNNRDYVQGIGVLAMIGNLQGLGFNRGKDTLYIALGQRNIKLTKRIPTLALSPLTDRLVGSGDNILVKTASAGLTATLSLLSGPANVTLVGDTLKVPNNAATGEVKLVLSTLGDEDGWYPLADTLTITVKNAQGLTLKKIRDYRFGEAPFAVADSSVNGTAGRTAFIRVLRMSPANTVSFDTTTQTFTINSVGSVIYQAIASGDTNFSQVIIQDTFQILRANQQIVWTPLADKTFGDAPITLAATVNSQVTGLTSGVTPIYTVTTLASVATYSAATQTITIVGAGIVIVRVAAAGNANYNAATILIDTFMIAQRAQTLSVDSIPNLFIGSGFYNIIATTAAPNSGVALQYSLVVAPLNVTFVGTPARINVPAAADTGWVTLRVIQPSNANHLADTVFRRFRIDRIVGLASNVSYQALQVWPNPATNLIMVKGAAEMTFSLISTNGKLVAIMPTQISEGDYQLDLSSLPNGIYQLIARTNTQHYTAKVAKQ